MKKKNRLLRIALLIAFLAFFGPGQNAWAATVTSTGTGNWNVGTTWVGNSVPGASDDVVIASGHTVTMDANSASLASVTINDGGTLVTSTYTLTVTGNLTVGGGASGTLTATGGTLVIGGTITVNGGTFTTDNTTALTLNGTGAVTLPAIVTALQSLTINKTDHATVKLGADATIGFAGNSVVLTDGYLDLNGHNLTLGNHDDAVIVETSPYRIINSGASAYVTTRNMAHGKIIASGIGVTAITAGTYQVYRYPLAAGIAVASGVTSIDRVYFIDDGGTAPTTLTLQFDNAGVSSIITDLRLYSSAAVTMTSAVNHGNTNRTLTPGAGKSTVGYTSLSGFPLTSDNYYTLASEDVSPLPNTKTFLQFVNTNWSEAGNWLPTGVPAATDSVIIPTGKSVVVNANGVCKSITVVDATASVASGITLDVKRHINLLGTSSLTAAAATAAVTFTGGTAQKITKSEDSFLEFGNLTVNAAGTAVTTSSDFTVKGTLTTTAGTFTANAGLATFLPPNGGTVWAATGAITLNDVLVNTAAGNVAPATSITVRGSFTKVGGNNFAPTAGIVTFQNTDPVGKHVQMTGGTNNFWSLAIANGSKVLTSSDFRIASTGAGAIDVQGNGSFIAQAGTITFNGGTAASIDKAAAGTLKFNNLTIGAATATASDFTINGNLTTTAALTASAGTITFENSIVKDLTFTTAPTFANLKVAENSKVATKTNHTFTIIGSITVEAGAEFTQAAAGTTTFGGGTTKNIVVDPTGKLTFGILSIADVASNKVQTASNFTVAANMVYAAVTNNPSFDATAGTVTFTATTPTITSSGSNPMSFYNLEIKKGTVTLAASQLISIKKDLILSKDGTDGVLTAADATPTVTFLGAEDSKITGTSEAAIPATFGVLVVNKTGGKEVLLETDAAIFNAGTMTFTSGNLNLGSKTLSSGANAITATGGAINGGTGTYKVVTGHATTLLADDIFTVGGVPTLYNLTLNIANTVAGSLTVNNDLDWSAAVALTIGAGETLTLKGNLLQTAAGTIVGGDAASTLKLVGAGSCVKLDDALLTTMPSLTFERGETLTGDLTMIANNVFTINTSVSNLDIGANTLTFNNATVLSLMSGGIKADAGSVVLGTGQTSIPANLFVGDVVNNLTIAAATTLGSDLKINGTLTGVFNITTNNNTLTFGPSATLPVFTSSAHVIGNLRRTVTNTATAFPIGDGTANGYRLLTLQFATIGSSQVVKVSSAKVNPALGRAGDPTRVINALWTITPEGTAPADSLKTTFAWGSDYSNGLGFSNTTTFLAKWKESSWKDYRKAAVTYAAGPPLSLTPNAFPVLASDLAGEWTVFNATANTDVAKDAAIAADLPKIAIIDIDPNPVDAGFPFSVTIQLQDKYGNPLVAPAPIAIAITDVLGTVTAPPATIAAGESTVIVPGFSYATAGAGYQFKATPTPATISVNGDTKNILPGISPVINVLSAAPVAQASDIVLSEVAYTSVKMAFTLAAGDAVVLAKAGSAITNEEFPVDGETYLASTNYGQGSTIGEAVVVYKGAAAGTPVVISGLAPGTKYYFRAFSVAGSGGSEKYNTFSAANNPKSVETLSHSEFDDDVIYGPNDTRLTAKPIGTNSPIKAMLKSASDEDWFSFMVTSSTPNVRAQIYNLPGNYTLEVYDMSGNRIRRSTLNSRANEAAVINSLPSGTYTVRIFSHDGSFRTRSGEEYYLKVSTFGTEIYSVTP